MTGQSLPKSGWVAPAKKQVVGLSIRSMSNARQNESPKIVTGGPFMQSDWLRRCARRDYSVIGGTMDIVAFGLREVALSE